MKKLLYAALILAISSVSVQAKQLTKEQVPAKLLEHFKKKHPKTTNLVITEQKHFGQSLYKLSFIEELMIKVPDDKGEKLKSEMAHEEGFVYYRSGGQFFVNAQKIEAFNVIPGIVIDGLKAAFPDYKITAAQIIVNPNGTGEEYEVAITSGGQNWNVGLDAKGTVITKDNLTSAPAATAAPAAQPKPAAKEAAAPKK
jgi:hypothetical protein